MEIVLIGVNHRTAPVELRERVSFTPDEAQRAAEQLRARGVLSETLVLSTCNRSEPLRRSARILRRQRRGHGTVPRDVPPDRSRGPHREHSIAVATATPCATCSA